MDLPETIPTDEGLTVVGASPGLLEELLDAYVFELKRTSPAIHDSMLPGLSEGQIRDQLGEIGMTPTAEVVVWWKWRNGHTLGFPNGLRHAQMSLATSISLYQSSSLGTSNHQWNPDWIRVAGEANPGVAACCRQGPLTPLVRHVDSFDLGTQDDESTLRQVVSLCTPITWWLTAIQNGWDTWIPATGFWRYDDSQYLRDWRVTLLM